MKGFREKCEKPPFFWTVFWPKWAKWDFFKKALGTFLSRLQALNNCKVSEKSNERFSSNRVTDGRTNGRESLGLQRLRRETKNQTIPMNQSEENWENLIFKHFSED